MHDMRPEGLESRGCGLVVSGVLKSTTTHARSTGSFSMFDMAGRKHEAGQMAWVHTHFFALFGLALHLRIPLALGELPGNCLPSLELDPITRQRVQAITLVLTIREGSFLLILLY